MLLQRRANQFAGRVEYWCCQRVDSHQRFFRCDRPTISCNSSNLGLKRLRIDVGVLGASCKFLLHHLVQQMRGAECERHLALCGRMKIEQRARWRGDFDLGSVLENVEYAHAAALNLSDAYGLPRPLPQFRHDSARFFDKTYAGSN